LNLFYILFFFISLVLPAAKIKIKERGGQESNKFFIIFPYIRIGKALFSYFFNYRH